jgi:serine/threonine protein kinase
VTSLGKYELLGRLGAGSSEIVYRARDQILGRHNALKVMRPEWELDPELAERFRREAQSAQLQHPNIVTVYDLGACDAGTIHIAIELLTCVDLRAAIFQRRPLAAAFFKIRLMAGVCEALGHAYRQEIVHRTVKPCNVFHGEGAQIKILDFGREGNMTIPKATRSETATETATLTFPLGACRTRHGQVNRRRTECLPVLLHGLKIGCRRSGAVVTGRQPVSFASLRNKV